MITSTYDEGERWERQNGNEVRWIFDGRELVFRARVEIGSVFLKPHLPILEISLVTLNSRSGKAEDAIMM